MRAHMRKIAILIIALFMIVSGGRTAFALFEIETDNINLEFGVLNIGDWSELNERGSYHNEIKCRSDNGNTWYLKVHLIDDFRSGTDVMSCSNLKWKVISVEGGDGIISNQGSYTDFSLMPQAVYTSGPADNNGTEVKIRLSYAISIPRSQAAGNYRTTVRYTFTELL